MGFYNYTEFVSGTNSAKIYIENIALKIENVLTISYASTILYSASHFGIYQFLPLTLKLAIFKAFPLQ